MNKDKKNYESKQIKFNAEKVVLLIFLINHIFMAVGSVIFNWDAWISVLIVVCAASTIIMHSYKKFSYELRVTFSVLMINLSLILYGTHSDHILSVLIPYISIIIVAGFYSIPELVIIPFISVSFVWLYQQFVIEAFSISNIHDYYSYGIPFTNLYFTMVAVYIWNKIWNKNRNEIDNAISELKKAEQSKDDFLANVSHEIRTPVNSVTGMSEIILREELPDEIRENVKNIQISGNRLVSIVSDILDFSELTSGKSQITDKPYSIADVINRIMSAADSMLKDKHLEFVISVDTDIPDMLIGDSLKIERVVLNIINNAIKFTNEGIVIVQISFRKESYGVNLSITVDDTGIGIADAAIENLFTVFNQVDTKRNRQKEGLGLGLAISRAIVEKMGGFISIKSKEGFGSSFKVVIPQHIEEYAPLVDKNEYKSCSVMTYVNMEQIKDIRIRDGYVSAFTGLVEGLEIQNHFCINLAELKRRVQRDYITHIFITLEEYLEDEKYFDNIAGKFMVIVCISKSQDKFIHSHKIVKLYRPFSTITIAGILAGERTDEINKKFIAPKAKILIVDDNMINLKVISGLLKPYQMELVLAESGMQALELIESKDYDMILLDHMMPEMDGIETLKRIREKDSLFYKEIPIIALTANAVAGAREMFISEGFQEFVSKPVEIAYLNNVLKAYLSADKIEYVDDFELVENAMGSETSGKNETGSDIKADETQAINSDEFEANVNVEQGSMYCGSYEDFLDVLKIHLDEGAENRLNIQKFYEDKDWKNYTILVHGLKSSMKSVGIEKLSEMARLLESAGKTEDEKYIFDNHDAMIAEYERIIGVLCRHFGVDEVDFSSPSDNEKEDEAEVDVASLVDISDEKFDDILQEMEDATFSWDGDKLAELASSLSNSIYKNKPLSKIAQSIQKKIEMSDYMSAYESLKAWKDKQS